MRLAGLAGAVALLLLGASGPSWAFSQDRISAPAATGTVPVTPLGPDEVLLELQVTGVSTLSADVTSVSIPVTRVAATPSAARAALAAETGRIAASARKAGIEARDIRVIPRDDSRFGMMGPDAEMVAAWSVEGAVPQKRRHMHGASVEIVLRDPARYEALRDAVETADTAVPALAYSLSDPARGEREARSDALRRARAEAEDYARSIGMRVGRLVRISTGYNWEMTAAQAMIRLMMPSGSSSATVETKHIVSVDYALVPGTAGASKR